MAAIDHLLDSLGRAIAARPDGGVRTWIDGCIREAGRKNAGEIHALLGELGATHADIHSLVHQKWVAPPGLIGDPRRLTAEQGRELVVLLQNLIGNAHFLNTCGSPRSACLRCQRWIDWLLSGTSPARRPGEIVGSGQAWELERFLGAGPSAETWLARDRQGNLPSRAYRIYSPEGARQWLEQDQGRLAAVVRRLGRHPNIVEWLEAGVSGEHQPYLAMEYADGGSLEDWLFEDPDHRSAFQKHEIIGGVVDAMAAAHRKGVPHGDLRPANILLTLAPAAEAKIAGFGLTAPAASGDDDRLDADRRMYLAPGALDGGLDPMRADLFALGVTWYQLLVDRLERPPYDFADVLRSAGHDSHTIAMVSRCLAGGERRYANAAELELEFAGEAPPQWPPVPKGCIDVSQIVREHLAGMPG